jgi:hypothetical protein
MRSRTLARKLLLATAFLLGMAATAYAAPLIEYQASSFSGSSNENEQLARVNVGAVNVQIGGFGVYGRARSDTGVAWVIFDLTDLVNPVFQSSVQQVGTAPVATWYDSPAMSFTLLANHTYAMGLVANKVNGDGGFWWATGDFPFGGGNQTANGLTLLDDTSGVRAGYCNGGFGPCGSTTQTLTSFMTGTYPDVFSQTLSTRTKMSLHIQAVPEPAEWTMLVAGLLAIAFIAVRRNKDLS